MMWSAVCGNGVSRKVCVERNWYCYQTCSRMNETQSFCLTDLVQSGRWSMSYLHGWYDLANGTRDICMAVLHATAPFHLMLRVFSGGSWRFPHLHSIGPLMWVNTRQYMVWFFTMVFFEEVVCYRLFFWIFDFFWFLMCVETVPLVATAVIVSRGLTKYTCSRLRWDVIWSDRCQSIGKAHFMK